MPPHFRFVSRPSPQIQNPGYTLVFYLTNTSILKWFDFNWNWLKRSAKKNSCRFVLFTWRKIRLATTSLKLSSAPHNAAIAKRLLVELQYVWALMQVASNAWLMRFSRSTGCRAADRPNWIGWAAMSWHHRCPMRTLRGPVEYLTTRTFCTSSWDTRPPVFAEKCVDELQPYWVALPCSMYDYTKCFGCAWSGL